MALIVLLVLFQLGSFASGAPLAPALFIFGDSLVDGGNNNFLPTHAQANYKPYGANFAAGTTGRFTNGKTVADFIAEFLGLPYVPPSMSAKDSIPVTGLNYASGSCGILTETGKQFGKCLSLDDQIGSFEAAVKTKLPKQFSSSNELFNYLSNSIYLFSVGSNDYIVNYLDPTSESSKHYTPQQFALLLTDKLSQSLQRLYNLGARKIVVFELGPIGCMPGLARKNEVQVEKCMEKANQLVSFFNKNLGAMLQSLRTTLPASKFVNGYAYWLSYDAISNPSKYGLTDSSNPCCTTAAHGSSVCIPNQPTCPNPGKFYFFDAYHPTEAANSILASRCINDKSVCSPPLNGLVKM